VRLGEDARVDWMVYVWWVTVGAIILFFVVQVTQGHPLSATSIYEGSVFLLVFSKRLIHIILVNDLSTIHNDKNKDRLYRESPINSINNVPSVSFFSWVATYLVCSTLGTLAYESPCGVEILVSET
jgi:hypothetical protein